MARLMPKRMMMAEGRQLGFYYRPTPDGKRILSGRARQLSRSAIRPGRSSFLRQGLVNLFPELENVRLSHTWFGNVAMHRDMLPRIFEKDGVVYADRILRFGRRLGTVGGHTRRPQAAGPSPTGAQRL